QLRADQDGRAGPLRPGGQVQPAPAHRGGPGRGGCLPRRRGHGARASRRAVSLRTRLVLAVAAGCALLLLALFPVREYLGQRRSRQDAVAQLRALAEKNRQLEERARLLHTDAEIERLAREQYNLVRPGEEAYALLPAPTSPPPPPLSAGLFGHFWERRLKP